MSAERTIEVDAAVIGAGPAGAAAAAALRRRGAERVLVLDRAASVGGVPSRYTDDGVATFLRLPFPRLLAGAAYARAVERDLSRSGAEVHLESTVTAVDLEGHWLRLLSPERGRYRVRARAIVCACGARERTAVESGWIHSRRPARVYNSMPMLDLMRRGLKPLSAAVALIGSRPAAYAMAAKLAANRAPGRELPMLDHSAANLTFALGRLYFARWASPPRQVVSGCLNILGNRTVEGIEAFPGGLHVTADYVLLSGDLVPNTELLAAAGVRIGGRTWRIAPHDVRTLEEGGVFLCGNIRGGEHGAHRASANGASVGRRAAAYLGSGSR